MISQGIHIFEKKIGQRIRTTCFEWQKYGLTRISDKVGNNVAGRTIQTNLKDLTRKENWENQYTYRETSQK